MKLEKMKKYNIVFSIIILFFIAILIYIPTGFENPSFIKNTLWEKALVIAVKNDLVHHGLITVGSQEVKMEVLTGKFEGEKVIGENVLLGQMKTDKIFKKGDNVLAVLKTDISGSKILSARADDKYRIDILIMLFLLFASFLIFFAKWTGFKALLSFVFTALVLWKVLIPMMMNGYNPIITALIILSIVTTAIILLVSGFNKKGLVALIGAISGVLITSALAMIFGHFFEIPGTVKEFSDALLYAGFLDLKLSDIFLATIFISASGAVMDVAMDIAASQNEIMEKKPNIKLKELISSGFKISYPVIGTMTTTLLFAYSGGFLFVFMVFMAKGIPLISIVNMNFISAEILHTIVGSFGLVLVAPITSIVGGYIYTKS